jgi:sRNA-binding carbon storage regulator CsrA
MLTLGRRHGDVVILTCPDGTVIRIHTFEPGGGTSLLCRLAIDAPRSIAIRRAELDLPPARKGGEPS